MEFATAHMEAKGWAKGEGLGKHKQGITDAIKPKLKFDQAGVGHNKADEFEFQWWDHVFNKAAKTVKVEEGEDGEVKVDFSSSKSELSTKKIRRKAEKAMKAEVKSKLYSNFVKSGTLTGGKMDGEGNEELVEDADMSKIRTLTDEELIKACGGRTAHKGGRHGHKMGAKLARIERAEKEYMDNFMKNNAPKTDVEPKKKKKRKLKELEDIDGNEATDEPITNDNLNGSEDLEPVSIYKPKKKKKKKDKNNSVEDLENLETIDEPRKKKNKDKSNCLDSVPITCDIKSKKKKRKKLKGGED